MTKSQIANGIVAQRLPAIQYAKNFADAHPPFDNHEAMVEADRCYYCYDAPCVTACPTAIDIPRFIQQIATGNLDGSAKTILTPLPTSFWTMMHRGHKHKNTSAA